MFPRSERLPTRYPQVNDGILPSGVRQTCRAIDEMRSIYSLNIFGFAQRLGVIAIEVTK
jgi:hypothetical protein